MSEPAESPRSPGAGAPAPHTASSDPRAQDNVVAGCLERGNAAREAGSFNEAIRAYSDAMEYATGQESIEVLRLRGSCWTALARKIKSTPAAASERHAIYALDPTQLAQMAYKDADAALSSQPSRAESAELLRLKAEALLLREKLPEAEDACLECLRTQPDDPGALALLREVSQALEDNEDEPAQDDGGDSPASRRSSLVRRSASKRAALSRSDELECVLCFKLLYEPVTTPCGHSFCKPCLARALDHRSACPLCRTVMHAGRELPVTCTLAAALKSSFPEEYEERRREEQVHAAAAGDGDEAVLPLFVMSLMLPYGTMSLNIFEPRYRLLVRRVMEGNRRLGMACVTRSHELVPIVCEAEITSCSPQPDGRFHIELRGTRRGEVLEAWETDGYRVARVKFLRDEAAGDNAAIAREVDEMSQHWMEKLRESAASGGSGCPYTAAMAARVSTMLRRAGERPTDPESLSFFIAGLLPLNPSQELKMLSTRSTKARLELLRSMLSTDDPHNSRCSVM
ncbi:unnamed protein product [Pedinophyceae sp. YPF-701]|nr:unnamed protein product [Pedinophyceae sp. YPF-701]